jgi:hypothetical protein
MRHCMTAKASLLAVMVSGLLVGCGSSGSDGHGTASSASVVGDWTADLGGGCVVSISFQGGKYVNGQGCSLDTGEVGVQSTAGTYTVVGNQLVMTPQQSTCHDHTKDPVSVMCSADATSMTWIHGTDVVVFMRDTSAGGSGAFKLGCFSPDGTTFTESPIAPL